MLGPGVPDAAAMQCLILHLRTSKPRTANGLGLNERLPPPPAIARDGGRRSKSEGRKAAPRSPEADESSGAQPEKDPLMRALKAHVSILGGGSHRVYRDPEGTDTAFCRLITSDDELLRLAAGIDRIEVRQAPGAGLVPGVIIDPLIENLRQLDLVSGSADPRAEQMQREARRRISDAMARIRIRCNRGVLAGVTRIFTHDEEQHVLVIVLARRGIRSCEWQLAA
jgi:hypothetical protein